MNQEQRQFIASTLLEILRDNANNRVTNALMEGAVGQLDRQIQQQYPEPEKKADDKKAGGKPK